MRMDIIIFLWLFLFLGADQNAINGEWELTSFTTNTVTFNASSSGLSNTTITGAIITMKIAPLGWSRIYYNEGNYIAVYQSNDPLSRRHILRVEEFDPTYYYIKVRGYELMTGVDDSGKVGAFPPSVSQASGLYWCRGINTNRKLCFTIKCKLDFSRNLQTILY